MSKRTNKAKRTVISIHGPGIDVDVSVSKGNGFEQLAAAFADAIRGGTFPGMSRPEITLESVINRGSTETLRALIKVAQAKIDEHEGVTPS